jgi:DNA primase
MPPRGSDDAVNQVKARVNLVDVVGQHVRLTKRGREFTGLCPFHQEKTPSFTLNEQMQSWYCFGCQKGGDLFTFVELIDKTDFRGALESLAERAGVELEQQGGAGRERAQLRRRIVDMNRLAAQYYEHVLWSTEAGKPGRALLDRRGVSEDTARRFQLGYAPGGENFANFLRKRGRALSDADAAGLLRRGRDFFQERLLVPIRNERGQPLAFTGRTVRADEPRKYVNSPETPAYIKGSVLFALDLAREGIEKAGHVALMEGQFDVIVAHQFGVANAIASSGTALTEEQVRLLKRFTEEVLLVFDADAAGKTAAFRAIEVAEREGLRTRVGTLPAGKDPDEFLRGGGDWSAVTSGAPAGWEFWIKDAVRDQDLGRPHDLQVALDRVQKVLARIPDEALRETYRQEAGRWLGYDPTLISLKPQERRPAVVPGREPPSGLAKRSDGNKRSVGKYLLQVLAARPDAAKRVQAVAELGDFEEDDRRTYVRMLETFERGGREALGRELPEYTQEEQDLIRRAWHEPPPRVDDEVVDDLVQRLRRDALQSRRRGIISDLREAESRGDGERIAQLEAIYREMTRAVEALRQG